MIKSPLLFIGLLFIGLFISCNKDENLSANALLTSEIWHGVSYIVYENDIEIENTDLANYTVNYTKDFNAIQAENGSEYDANKWRFISDETKIEFYEESLKAEIPIWDIIILSKYEIVLQYIETTDKSVTKIIVMTYEH